MFYTSHAFTLVHIIHFFWHRRKS